MGPTLFSIALDWRKDTELVEDMIANCLLGYFCKISSPHLQKRWVCIIEVYLDGVLLFDI